MRNVSRGTVRFTRAESVSRRAVVIEEEEQLVFNDGTADVTAKLVADERRPGYGRRGVIVKPVVGFQVSIAVIFHQRPVERIGSAFGHEFILATTAAGRTGKVPGRYATELLHRVDWGSAHYGPELASGIVVDIKSIHRDAILIGARTGHRTVQGDSRLLHKERRRIASVLHRQIVAASVPESCCPLLRRLCLA